MELTTILFWVFSAVTLGCGLIVITRHNPVNSAMFLILLFLGIAGLFLLLEAYFLALVQVVVYAGAVMVLFLFVIMLLNVPAKHQERSFPRIAVFGATLLATTLGLEFFVLLRRPVPLANGPTEDLHGGLEAVLRPLFTHYLLPLELVALIILSAMIGVIVLSKREVK